MIYAELKALKAEYPADRFDIVFDESGSVMAVAEKKSANNHEQAGLVRSESDG